MKTIRDSQPYLKNYRIKTNVDLLIDKEHLQELILKESKKLEQHLDEIENDLKRIKLALKTLGIVVE